MSKTLFTRSSIKDLGKLGSLDRKRVLTKIELLNIPLPDYLDIKKLAGLSGFFRLRVGQVRVIFELDTKTDQIWIREIGYRGNVYRY